MRNGLRKSALASLALSGIAIFLIGAGTTLFTGRTILFSGIKQLLIGYAAAGITFGIGYVFGVLIGG
jgi:VIT1/CCC1 family predicted Fe2+/Mn2+ transporter